MSRRLSGMLAWGALVFSLTLVLNLPAAFVLRQLNWPPGWQPAGVSGSLWQGRIAHLGVLGPLDWQFRPWARETQLNLGFGPRIWALSIQGWPWNWQAQLAPHAVSGLPRAGFMLDGEWQGRLQLSGAGRECRNSEGTLIGSDLALLTPWQVNLGTTRIELQCQGGLRVLAELQLANEHRFNIEADLARQRAQVQGWVEPAAAVTPLLVQARWLTPGQQSFSKMLGKP